MPITVIVRSTGMSDARLTFDGLQRVVIGRGASSDVRLPDASVSHRHACLGANGAEYVLTDEGSTNGTFVGQVRLAPRTSRIIRSGDMVRVGRIWLELRVEPGPVTRDLAVATRDLALALVSHAMAARGTDFGVRIRVVEGPDQGASLALAEEKRAYVLGRDPSCDLALSDSNVSRIHARVERQGNAVVVRDLGGKNGTWLGAAPASATSDAAWRPKQMMRIGRTVVALEDPLCDLLADVEGAPDEPLSAGESLHPPGSLSANAVSNEAGQADQPADGSLPPRPKPTGLSVGDLVVIAAALAVLALSVAALVWLLRF